MRASRTLALIGALALLSAALPAQKDEEGGLKPGDTVKELKLKTLSGKQITVPGLKKGTILVLNFWGMG